MATAMDGGHRAANENSQNSANWMMAFLAMAATSLAAYAGFVRPAQLHLAALETQCDNLAAAIEELNESHASAKRSGSLVAILSQQQKQLEEAEWAVAQLDAMRRRVIREADQTTAAIAALDDLSDLQTEIEGFSRSLAAARRSLDVADGALDGAFDQLTEMEDVSRSINATSDAAREARQSLSVIDQLHGDLLSAMGQLGKSTPVIDAVEELCDQIVAAEPTVRQAAAAHDDVSRQIAESTPVIGAMSDLCDVITAAEPRVNEASVVSNNMIALQERLNGQQPEVASAHASLGEYERLCDRIEARDNQVALSHQQLGELIKLKDALITRTDDVVDALATLEHLSSLTEGLLEANGTVGQIQHMVVDVMLMQPAVERAVHALRPVVEFTRMSRRVPVDQPLWGQTSASDPQVSDAEAGPNKQLDVAAALLNKK